MYKLKANLSDIARLSPEWFTREKRMEGGDRAWKDAEKKEEAFLSEGVPRRETQESFCHCALGETPGSSDDFLFSA